VGHSHHRFDATATFIWQGFEGRPDLEDSATSETRQLCAGAGRSKIQIEQLVALAACTAAGTRFSRRQRASVPGRAMSRRKERANWRAPPQSRREHARQEAQPGERTP